ncbi:flavin reductase [Micrococcaceae bacterium Sec5.1]
MPANSLVSVSLDPALHSIPFAHINHLAGSAHLAALRISVLGEQSERVLNELRDPGGSRFVGIEIDVDDGSAFVRGALARLVVEPHTAVEAAERTLMLLEVLSVHRDEDQRPLVFFSSRTHRLRS